MSVIPMDRQARTPGGRTPPHNLAAEESLLGAMLLSTEAINNVAALVSADDFYKPAHGHIFDAIVTVYARAERPDVVTVAAELERANLIDAIGGPSALTTLQAGTPSTTAAASYARLVAEQATLRRLIGVAGEIAEIGYSSPDDIPAAVDRAQALLYEIGDQTASHAVTSLRDVLYKTLEHMEAVVDGTAEPGVTTGLLDLDEITGGFPLGSLVCTAARPAMGKTQVGTHIAAHIAAQGTPVLLVSAEMGDVQMGERFLARESGVSLSSIRSGVLGEGHWHQITAGTGVLGDLPVYLMTLGGPTVLAIRSAARQLATTLRKPPIIVVDYLQLLRGPKAENRNNEVAQLSWGLKGLAIDLNTVVITLSQLSRQLESRADKRPMLSDLRDSGAIEQDSDVVVFLYRDEIYHPDTDHKGVAELIVAKNRHGRTGTAVLGYEPSTGRYFPARRF